MSSQTECLGRAPGWNPPLLLSAANSRFALAETGEREGTDLFATDGLTISLPREAALLASSVLHQESR